jgi:3-deoxy-manno-octulosonate cytidylyltransferase (CMP-KDO synthetase)
MTITTPDLKFTVLIPARLASARLPNKPLLDIQGLPMIVRVAQRALSSRAKAVAVATDSQAIIDACVRHGIHAVMTRSDHPTGSDRLAEACDVLGFSDDAIVVNVQGDEPLISASMIEGCAHALHQDPECIASTTAHAISDAQEFLNPNVVKVVTDANHRALFFSRAPIPYPRDQKISPNDGGVNPDVEADAPGPAALRHVGLYAYRAKFLRAFPRLPICPLEQIECLEQLRILWHGHRIAVWITPERPLPGVDTLEDLERVRSFLQEQNKEQKEQA